MSKLKYIFPYTWHLDQTEFDRTVIRTYGLTENNENICIHIEDFTPYVYIELPTTITWDDAKVKIVRQTFEKFLGDKYFAAFKLVKKKKFYGANIKPNETNKYNDLVYNKYPYIFCAFPNYEDIDLLYKRLFRPIHVDGIGRLQFKIHERKTKKDDNFFQILQLLCIRNIPTAGWISFEGHECTGSEKRTYCSKEYLVSYKSLSPEPSMDGKMPKPKVMSFDLEAFSSNPSRMPTASLAPDKIFQVSAVISETGSNTFKKYLLSLGDPDQETVGKDVIIKTYPTEPKLLLGFTELIQLENPNIIAGHNIFGFDIPYMVERSINGNYSKSFSKMGFYIDKESEYKEISWSSTAFKDQKFHYLDAEGRLFIDILPLIKRDYKLSNYKLKTIAENFKLGTKDPLSHLGIFKCYQLGTAQNSKGEYTKKGRKAMAICGKYCVKDSELVSLILNATQSWVGLVEMAKTCNVPIFSLYTEGQQMKVYAQIYKYCLNNSIVIDQNGYTINENENYVGAHVFPPVPGKYEMVVPFDFASLYPSTIIAYNIDYITWVNNPDIPDELCNVMEWTDHIGCEHDPNVIKYNELSDKIAVHEGTLKKLRDERDKLKNKKNEVKRNEIVDKINKFIEEVISPLKKERSILAKSKHKNVMCEKRYYRFLKEPKGILPTIIQNLLDARAKVRNQDITNTVNEKKKLIEKMKELEINNDLAQIDCIKQQLKELDDMLEIYEKRQLSFKLSANSMYGIMGISKGGKLPFMPGAMCTTYMGRTNIHKVCKLLTEKYKGELVYGDTDSNYVHFPHLKTAREIWDYSISVADEISKIFPKPIKLEFEKKIYAFFLILAKKYYMYRYCKADGIINNEIGSKGVLLARRDNSKFVRDIYEHVVSLIADNKPKEFIYDYLFTEINSLCSGCKPLEDFVITKSVGSYGDLIPVPYQTKNGTYKASIGNYKTPLLSSNPEERQQQLMKKKVDTPEEFYLSCLPAQVQLADKMGKRGMKVDPGTRLEYVIVYPDEHNKKLSEKIESLDYVKKYKDIIQIDFLHYLKALSKPMDTILSTTFKDENVTLNRYKFLIQRNKMLEELKSMSMAKIIYNDNSENNPENNNNPVNKYRKKVN